MKLKMAADRVLKRFWRENRKEDASKACRSGAGIPTTTAQTAIRWSVAIFETVAMNPANV
jgi:hypothetical protein